MKKFYLNTLSFVSLAFMNVALAADTPTTQSSQGVGQFTAEQVKDIKKIVTEHLFQQPDVIMAAFQTGMEQKQKEEVAKIEKAVIENKDKIFKSNPAFPTAGNTKNPTQELVLFMDPYCGYCKKFHGELGTLLNTNKDVRVTFIDVPIMGPGSFVAIKALLAAKEQNKYDQLQQAIFSADKHLSKKQILKIAKSLGIDTKQLEKDMKSKAIQAQVNRNEALVKTLGMSGTPTLIIGGSKVVPGFLSAEEVNKLLKETTSSASGTQPTVEKPS